MKRVLVLLALCLFVLSMSGLAFAKKECKDPSKMQWDPKSGTCIEKTQGPKCEDPSRFQWDPQANDGAGACIEKVKNN